MCRQEFSMLLDVGSAEAARGQNAGSWDVAGVTVAGVAVLRVVAGATVLEDVAKDKLQGDGCGVVNAVPFCFVFCQASDGHYI